MLKTSQECETALTLQYDTLFLVFVFCLFVFMSFCIFVFMSFCTFVFFSFFLFLFLSCLFVFLLLVFLSFYCLSFCFLSDMSEGSQVSKVTLCVKIQKWQWVSEWVTKARYRAARAAKNNILVLKTCVWFYSALWWVVSVCSYLSF